MEDVKDYYPGDDGKQQKVDDFELEDLSFGVYMCSSRLTGFNNNFDTLCALRSPEVVALFVNGSGIWSQSSIPLADTPGDEARSLFESREIVDYVRMGSADVHYAVSWW